MDGRVYLPPCSKKRPYRLAMQQMVTVHQMLQCSRALVAQQVLILHLPELVNAVRFSWYRQIYMKFLSDLTICKGCKARGTRYKCHVSIQAAQRIVPRSMLPCTCSGMSCSLSSPLESVLCCCCSMHKRHTGGLTCPSCTRSRLRSTRTMCSTTRRVCVQPRKHNRR